MKPISQDSRGPSRFEAGTFQYKTEALRLEPIRSVLILVQLPVLT